MLYPQNITLGLQERQFIYVSEKFSFFRYNEHKELEEMATNICHYHHPNLSTTTLYRLQHDFELTSFNSRLDVIKGMSL